MMAVAVLIVVVAYVGHVHEQKVKRFLAVNSLFKEHLIVENFRNLNRLGFEFVNVSTGGAPVAEFVSDEVKYALPDKFQWNGTSFGLQQWLEEHWTTGLVVIKRDSDTKARLLYEKYYRGNAVQSRAVSWSMCKTVVSALLGIAVKEGMVGDITKETITDYVPSLIGSGYEGVRIVDVLQMSSGIAFNEDYFNPFSDINQMGYTVALGWSIDSFVASLKRESQPGQFNRYISMDTQALAMLLIQASGMSLSEFAQRYLWSKVGFEYDAVWLLDNDVHRTELAFGVLGVTTRDYARLGWLYLNNGTSPATGERILSKNWVRASLTADKPHLMPGDANTMSDYPTFGYGYQIWLCPKEDDPNAVANDFMAIGVYGQLIYVSPDDNIIIAKNAADPHYPEFQHPTRHENFLETQGFRAMREIAQKLRDV